MSKSDQHLQDIHSTGEEAELLLEALESDQPASPTDPESTDPVSHQYTKTGTGSAKDQAHPAVVLLTIAILLSPGGASGIPGVQGPTAAASRRPEQPAHWSC